MAEAVEHPVEVQAVEVEAQFLRGILWWPGSQLLCDAQCQQYNDCCADYVEVCVNGGSGGGETGGGETGGGETGVDPTETVQQT